MTADRTVLSASDLHRTYGSGRRAVHAVAGISLSVTAGEVLALMGPSGCGKSTLLALLGGLDRPDSGSVQVAGQDWRDLKGRRRIEYRRATCGYVFQNLALLPAATASENVEVPLVLAGVRPQERAGRVEAALAAVDMTGRAHNLPDQLSGGEQQRIGVARALVHRPALVLADEPTGSLDSHNAAAITRLLVAMAAEQGAAVVLVTHDPHVAEFADRVLRLHSGCLDTATSTAADEPARSRAGRRE